MWSLPDISRLNASAAANVKALRREAKRKRKPQCEHYGCQNRAVESVEWFDIFSDDPKGLVHVCAEHPADSAGDFFPCARCERLMADHYTWERYRTTLNGDVVCLKCAAESYFADEKNWIDPKAVKDVVSRPSKFQDPRSIPLFDARTGIFNPFKCRHILGVQQPIPAGVRFLENFEFDSQDGHQISGGDVREAIRRLAVPFCPVLDSVYQFAVSLGLYARSATREQTQEAA